MDPEAALGLWFEADEVAPLGAGHIHDTYLVTVGTSRYVLQRVNEQVFTDGQLVMSQTQRLLRHWPQQSAYRLPPLVSSARGNATERTDDGLWRVWEFVEQTRVIDPVRNYEQAAAAGRAFGYFQSALRTLPGEPLAETIAGFLQLGGYLREFDTVAHRAPAAERALIELHRPLAAELSTVNCVIHGDCKVNNLLFHHSDESVVAIIDLDTAMPGHWAWDFGDLVRSVSFSRGGVDVAYFRACLAGFAEHQDQTSVAESVAAPAYVALMLGVRFLTDHLRGNVYFRVSEPNENLHRAREQLALFEDFQRQRSAMLNAAREVLEG